MMPCQRDAHPKRQALIASKEVMEHQAPALKEIRKPFSKQILYDVATQNRHDRDYHEDFYEDVFNHTSPTFMNCKNPKPYPDKYTNNCEGRYCKFRHSISLLSR